jgi:hypothetical protein
VACELELDGIVAVLQTVVRDPEFEDRPLDKELRLREDIFSAVNGLVTAQFGGRIELSREVEIRRGSLVIVLTLITAGRVIIEYGALMQGLRELARLVPDRIRDVLGRRRPGPGWIEPTQVILGPTVLVARPAKPSFSVSPTMIIALSAGGGAALIVAGVLLGHFL